VFEIVAVFSRENLRLLDSIKSLREPLQSSREGAFYSYTRPSKLRRGLPNNLELAVGFFALFVRWRSTLCERSQVAHLASLVPGEGSLDLRRLIHNKGSLCEDRLANLGSRKYEEVGWLSGLKLHLSVSVQGNCVIPYQVLRAAIGLNGDLPLQDINDRVLTILQIKRYFAPVPGELILWQVLSAM